MKPYETLARRHTPSLTYCAEVSGWAVGRISRFVCLTAQENELTMANKYKGRFHSKDAIRSDDLFLKFPMSIRSWR